VLCVISIKVHSQALQLAQALRQVLKVILGFDPSSNIIQWADFCCFTKTEVRRKDN